MSAGRLLAQELAAPRASRGSFLGRVLWHGLCLLIALGCLAAYAHFKGAGQSTPALVSLVTGAGFGFVPLRDVLGLVFRIEGAALRLVHLVGGLGLLALPLTGVVSGGRVLTGTAMAPFAIMGAAQALMHQNHPRSAKQAAAMQSFAASLPEVAQFTSAKNLSSPENAQRAIVVLSGIVAKAQALGETELESDPGFQSALSRVSTRFGANLGLDAVDLALGKLAANPAAAAAVPGLREQVATARRTITAAAKR
jgi:hypothetical protein